MCASPISPSISALGVSAATESMTTRSTAPLRTSISRDVEGLLAGVGLRDEELLGVDADAARVGDVERVLGVDERAHAAARCASAMACSASVVLPLDSGP